MAITNIYLNNLASSQEVTAYLAVTTSTDFNPSSVSASILPGEFGSRITATATRNNNVVTWSGIRPGAVVSSGGENLTGVALFTASSGGDMMFTAPLISLTHTTNFDIEFNFETTYTRR
jgi:hypothetical protein